MLFRFLSLVLGAIFSTLVIAQSVQITTAPWQPYVTAEHRGTAVELLRQVYSQRDVQINWLTQNYDLAYQQVATQQKLASFPYFKTEQRAQQVLYSAPVFSVTSRLYFNRQYNQQIDLKQLGDYKLGKVAGYSYGAELDVFLKEAVVFSSEKEAVEQLFAGKVDYLPMTESVMNHLLNTQFEQQRLLIKALQGLEAKASLHLIAANNPKGAAIVKQLNQLLHQVEGLQSFKLQKVAIKQQPDIAQLITTEGYPAILAQRDLSSNTHYFTLAQGTKVLVLEWSNKLTQGAPTDRIYKNMMDVSKVVILNGPLVGKELFVRNMHIELL